MGVPLTDVPHLPSGPRFDGIEITSEARIAPDERILVLFAIGRGRQGIHDVHVAIWNIEVANQYTTCFPRQPSEPQQPHAIEETEIEHADPTVAFPSNHFGEWNLNSKDRTVQLLLPNCGYGSIGGSPDLPRQQGARERHVVLADPCGYVSAADAVPDIYLAPDVSFEPCVVEDRSIVLGLERIQSPRSLGVFHQHHCISAIGAQEQGRTSGRKQRELRAGFPETMGLRVHRSISWIGRAEDATDDDGRFIFLWIGFNVAYADEEEFHNTAPGERAAFTTYFRKVVTLDPDQRVYDAIWNNFSGPIRGLLHNRYVFNPF